MKAELNDIADEVMRKYRGLPKDYAGHIPVGKGASGSDTSKIDKFAEDAVLAFMDEQGIGLNVLSEEIGFVDRGGKKTLVLDPIDGTVNCTRGIPFFSISMAVCSKTMADCDHALVRNLFSGDTYYARRGGGAELNGHRIAVSKFNRDDSLFLMFDGRDVAPESEKVKAMASRVRTMGCASLEMCLVAQGSAQAHYMNCTKRSRMIRIVDIAASCLILREAGGEVVDLTGNKLDMELSLDDRKNFLAYGDPKIKELVL
ncbi:MAG TPA: inositol monophosphatase [Thermoplasmata archaeon]|nr:inositol monophosphatase [Thermoplasmata archaeon]